MVGARCLPTLRRMGAVVMVGALRLPTLRRLQDVDVNGRAGKRSAPAGQLKPP